MNKSLTTSEPVKKISLQQMVDQETENRKILTEFIKSHMQEGTDFGSIKIGGRDSKPCLFKAGAEKFASLMKLRADVVKDQDTWEMSGLKEGLFCYKCRLFDQKGNEVGMGLGACSVEEKKNFNNAIKIAKKRAFVDAILTTGALSDFFTQDLEDQTDNPVKETHNYTQDSRLITEKQIGFIKNLAVQKGSSYEDIEEMIYSQSGKKVEEISQEQASQVINVLMRKKDKVKPSSTKEETEEINMDEASQAVDAAMLS